jgi:hypothetical protein
LAEAQARKIHEVSGRPMFGGGVHLDTAVPHWHSHIPKTSEAGELYPKGKFLTGGPWLTGAVRVERKFPGLLSEWKRKRMREHLERKRRENLVDLAATEAVDAELERWIRERGLWPEYERDCAEYVRKKTRAQNEEPVKRMVQAALGFHSKTGLWPLAYQAMSLTAWRMVPPELRAAVIVSIRLVQVIRTPTPNRIIGLGKSLARLAEPAPITLPRTGIR